MAQNILENDFWDNILSTSPTVKDLALYNNQYHGTHGFVSNIMTIDNYKIETNIEK